MAKVTLQPPISFTTRPINKGLNFAEPPQGINGAETPSTMNTRLFAGLAQSRTGFKAKYKGLEGAAVWIDVAYDAGSSIPICFTQGGLYQESGGIFTLADWYEGAAPKSYPYFSLDPSAEFISVDIGEGKFDFSWANGGALFPVAGDYADIMGVVLGGSAFIVAYTGVGTGVEAEKLDDGVRVGVPTGCRCCVFYDNRLVVATNGGGSNYATIQWSAKGRPDYWDPATYADAGEEIIGDSPDWIQNMKRLGEYLVIYKERSIYVGRKSMLSDPAFYFDPAPGQGIGLAAPNSIGDLGSEHLFLGWDDVYSFSARGLQAIGTRIKSELFYGGNGILPQYIHTVDGIIAEEWDEYWLFVPSGKWPEAFNCVRNPTIQDLDGDDVVDDYWQTSVDGDGQVSFQSGGNFGNGEFVRMTFTTGTYVLLRSDKYDFNTSIFGRTFTVMVYAKASVADYYRIVLDQYNSGGGSVGGQSYDFLMSAEWARYAFTIVLNKATAEQVSLTIWSFTSGANLDVDAVQVVDITDISDEFLYAEMSKWPYNAKVPGYIGPDGSPILIPLITGDWAFSKATPHNYPQIGPWLADTMWVYNYEHDAWSAWRLPATGFGYDTLAGLVTISDLIGKISEQGWRFDEKRIEAFAPVNLIGEPDGNIYEVSAASTKDWEGIPESSIPVLFLWESKDFDLDRPTLSKTISRVVMLHDTSHSAVSVTVGVSLDSGVNWTEQVVTVRNGKTETYADFFVTGPQVRVRFKSENALYVQGFAMKLIPRGESFDAT